jgi:Zinc-binding dehydrogenase
VVELLGSADSVVITPGYGIAVAQEQCGVAELTGKGAGGSRPAPGVPEPGADAEPDRPRLHPGRFAPTHHDAFLRDMAAWVRDGSVRYREDVVDGLEQAPEAFRGLLAGRNLGKLLVRVRDDPTT